MKCNGLSMTNRAVNHITYRVQMTIQDPRGLQCRSGDDYTSAVAQKRKVGFGNLLISPGVSSLVLAGVHIYTPPQLLRGGLCSHMNSYDVRIT